MSHYTIQRQQKIDGIEKFEVYVNKLISGDLARFSQFLPSLDSQIGKNKINKKSKKTLQGTEINLSSNEALIDIGKSSTIETAINDVLNKLKQSIILNAQKSKKH